MSMTNLIAFQENSAPYTSEQRIDGKTMNTHRRPVRVTSHMGQGRAGQGRAGQGRAGQGRAGQGRAGQGRAGQGRAGQGRAGQGRAGQGRAHSDQYIRVHT